MKNDLKAKQNFIDTFNRLSKPFKVIPSVNKILIISSCTAKKLQVPMPLYARNMYQGQQAVQINELIRSGKNVDYYILSAGYGLIEAHTLIDKYDSSFNDLGKKDLRELRSLFQVRQAFDLLMRTNEYELVFVLLGDVYLELLELKQPFTFFHNPRIVFFPTQDMRKAKRLPSGNNIELVNLRDAHLRKYHASRIWVKGKMIRELFEKHTEQDILNNVDNLLDFPA